MLEDDNVVNKNDIVNIKAKNVNQDTSLLNHSNRLQSLETNGATDRTDINQLKVDSLAF